MAQSRTPAAAVHVRRLVPALLAMAVLAACGDAGTGARAPSPTPSAAAGDPAAGVTVTVAPSAAGLVEPLLAEYAEVAPGVRIEIAAYAPDAGAEAPGLLGDLEAGRGLADVVVVDGAARDAAIARPELFRDLRGPLLDARVGDLRAWNLADGTTRDGRQIGLPMTIAPVALCFRHDLLAGAGIAQDRDELAALLSADGGGWDVFFDLGRRYREATGAAWFDQPHQLWDAMVAQLPQGYSTADGTVTAASDPALRARWDLLAAAIGDGLSAGEGAWDWHGGRAFVDGTFATTLCPSWMLDVVERNVTVNGGDASTGWDVVDALPGGPLALSGDFMAVSATAAHPEEAVAFAFWLADAVQRGPAAPPRTEFPASRTAADRVAADGGPDPFFNDAPVGRIFAARAEGATPGVGGPLDRRVVDEAFGPVLQALDTGEVAASASWDAVMARLADLPRAPG